MKNWYLIDHVNSQVIEQKTNLISIKGRNFIANLKKMTIYNTKLDLVHDNVYTQFG